VCSHLRLLFGALWLGLIVHNAPAVTVHTWLDADGVRHFADEPFEGEDAVTAPSVIEIPDNQHAVADDDYYSILNQWSRLRAERERADLLSLERSRLRAQEERAPADEPPQGQGGVGLYQRYWPPYIRERVPRHHDRPRIDREAYLREARKGQFIPYSRGAWPRERAAEKLLRPPD